MLLSASIERINKKSATNARNTFLYSANIKAKLWHLSLNGAASLLGLVRQHSWARAATKGACAGECWLGLLDLIGGNLARCCHQPGLVHTQKLRWERRIQKRMFA